MPQQAEHRGPHAAPSRGHVTRVDTAPYGVETIRIFVVHDRLNRILGFVLYGMAVYLDMKPSVQAASTRLC